MYGWMDKQTVTNVIDGSYNAAVGVSESTSARGECLDVLPPMKFKMSARILSREKAHSYLVSLPVGKNVRSVTHISS